MSLIEPEGFEECEEDVVLSARIFATALGNMLQEMEGICIVIDDVKYYVYRADGRIIIDPVPEIDNHVEHGQMLWMYKETLQ